MLMKDALSYIRQILDSNDIRYNENEIADTYRFYMTFGLQKSKLSSINVILNVTSDFDNPNECTRIESYAFIGIKADESCMAEMGEFLHRANYGMIFGCFEMDYDDGEIRFKMSINCDGTFPSREVIESLWYIPAIMADRYGNGILAVSLGLASAQETIEKIES